MVWVARLATIAASWTLACEGGHGADAGSSTSSTGDVDAPDDESTTEPVDDDPVELADPSPPPIYGGTLLVSRDGSFAIASDPDRDVVHVVDLETETERKAIELEANCEGRPFVRQTEDDRWNPRLCSPYVPPATGSCSVDPSRDGRRAALLCWLLLFGVSARASRWSRTAS